jgi:hypothetical protein
MNIGCAAHEFRSLANGNHLLFADPVQSGFDRTGLATFGANQNIPGCEIGEIDPADIRRSRRGHRRCSERRICLDFSAGSDVGVPISGFRIQPVRGQLPALRRWRKRDRVGPRADRSANLDGGRRERESGLARLAGRVRCYSCSRASRPGREFVQRWRRHGRYRLRPHAGRRIRLSQAPAHARQNRPTRRCRPPLES